MRRIELEERPDWRAVAEREGFTFHYLDGEIYWDETAAYAFSLKEIEEDLEAPTEELHAMCLDLVAEAVGSEALMAQLASAPGAYQAAEVARMEVVMRSFALYKIIELALFAVGVGLTYAFRNRETLYAVGIGLVLQSSLMLVADLFAEKRGDEYLEQVRGLSAPVSATVAPLHAGSGAP